MSFTHYPKTEHNLIMSWVFPIKYEDTRKVRRKTEYVSVPSMNLMRGDPVKGQVLVGCHSAQNFTRFYGSVYADTPVQLTYEFSNDEYNESGTHPLDNDLPNLHYDAEAQIVQFDPLKPGIGSKQLVTIYGKWLRVTLKFLGETQPSQLRVYIRGSVF